MKINVRACVLAVALILLGAGSMFAQNVWTVGAPTGSSYAATNDYNLAMNAEGNKELGAPVSICAGTPGGAAVAGAGGTAAAGAATNTFNVGDVYTIEWTIAGGGNDPVFSSTTIGAGNLQLLSSAAGVGVVATATAAMTQTGGATPPGATPGAPQAIVTITITGAAVAGTGINCITIQGLRFDLGNTNTATVNGTTFGSGVGNGKVINAVVKQTVYNGTTLATTNPVLGLPATGAGIAGSGVLNGAFPVVNGIQSAVNTVGSAFTTMAPITGAGIGVPAVGTGGALGLSNSSGVNQLQKFSPTGSGVATATVVNGPARTGTVSINENPIPANITAGACAPACPATGTPVNLPIQAGGGLFRGYFVAAGPDQTTWLNLAGATIGTGVTLTVSGMPTGSSVSFPAAVSSTSPGVVWQMVGGGTISAPGGSVTYNTTINEGTPYTIATAPTQVGPSMDILFTVTPGSVPSLGSANLAIAVNPPAGASQTPTYSQINLQAGNETAFPLVAIPANFIPFFTVGSNQTTRTYPYVTFTGGTTPTDYDTGIAITNMGRTASVVNGAPCFTVAAGATAPAGCNLIVTPATGTNIGQDGPFTVFFMSAGATVASIRSTASNFPNPSALTSGSLKQGATYAALASQLLSAAGVTGAFSGEVVVVTDFPNSNGFAFVSQFTNPSGGATMGYKVTAIAGEN